MFKQPLVINKSLFADHKLWPSRIDSIAIKLSIEPLNAPLCVIDKLALNKRDIEEKFQYLPVFIYLMT